MTKASTEPCSGVKGLIFAVLILPLGATSAPALANGIQMLPPVTEATKTSATPTPCPSGGSPNILTWDGTYPIACASGITVSGGFVGIGTTAPLWPSKLDVLGYGIDVGVDWVAGAARTDATLKGGYLTTPHYTNAQNPVGVIMAYNAATTNEVRIGGGTSNVTAATQIEFLTAANNTTTYGTNRMLIDSTGYVGIGSTAPTGNLDVEPTSAQIATSTPATICLNGICSPKLGFRAYVRVYGTNTDTTKGACGFDSTAYCPSGYTAISGGMSGGSNDELQNSEPVFDASGNPNGWFITVLDGSSAGFCSNNNIPNGTTASGSPPNLTFGTMQGDAAVLCGQN